MIVRAFKLFNSTIRYVYDTQHLNIICVISYFNIFPVFFSIITITTCMLLFYTAYTVPLDPHVVYYFLFAINLLFEILVNRDYLRLSFDYIVYYANNTSKRCVFVIYTHKSKCTTFIFVLLRFGLWHQYNIQYNTG